MNGRAVRAIIRKDLAVVRRSRALLVPLVAVPVALLVVLPAVLAVVPTMQAATPAGLEKLQATLAQLPPALRAGAAGATPQQSWILLVTGSLFAPMFLLVPFMVASVFAADSFAGERERKTLEALLYTPTTDAELFFAKVVAAWAPAMASSLLGLVLYAVVVNAAAWPVMGRLFFPNVLWLVLVVWLAPAFALLGLAAMVLVSLRVNTTQEAMQLGGLLVLPIIALVGGQVKGVLLLGPSTVFALGAIVWAIDGLLVWHAARTFRRAKLIARL